MAMNTTNSSELTPEQIGQLVVQPVMDNSVAAQVAQRMDISSHSIKIPLLTADPTAAWVAEAAEISASDATFDELEVVPSKVGALSVISRELAEDSSPAAQSTVGDGLARDIARKVDAAFFGNTTTNGPSGLGSLTTSTATYASGGLADLDWAADAISAAQQQGASLGYFVTDPATALAIAKLKVQTGSNAPLLGLDATSSTARSVLGVPLLVDSNVTTGTIWGIDPRFVKLVVRAGTRLEVDRSVYFTSDQVAVKATMRLGFAFTYPKSVVKVTKAAA